MAIERFNIGQDARNIPSYSLPISDSKTIRIEADTSTEVSIPNGVHTALFSSDSYVYIGTSALTLPAAGGEVDHECRPNGEVIPVKGISSLFVISREECDVTFSWYKNPNE